MLIGDFVALFYIKVIGLQSFNGKWPRALWWAVLRAARGKLTLGGTPNCLIYCDIFIVCTQFTNVVADRIIQAVGPRFGGPWSR